MVTMRDHKSNRPEQHAASDMPSGLLAEVRLLNDDQTTMEFVVQVLEEIFGKDRETATRIMLETHREGFGICGIYSYDIAEAKVSAAMASSYLGAKSVVRKPCMIARFIRLQAAAHLELWNRVVHSQRMWNAATGCLVC